MKTFALIAVIVIIVCLVGWGCKSFGSSLKYSVDIKNIGKNKIHVGHFQLYESKNQNLVVTGMFGPGVRKSSGPFYKRPNSKIQITWKDSESGKSLNDTIMIKLPVLFSNREYGANILIYINSDTNKIVIAYKVFDPKKQDFITVDSEGKTFDINMVGAGHDK